MTDKAARDRAHAIFDPIVDEYLRLPGVELAPMFGSESLRIRGKVFAFPGFGGYLILKIPASRARELAGTDGIDHMVMRERPMREWIVVPTAAADRWPALVAEAYAFVDEITP